MLIILHYVVNCVFNVPMSAATGLCLLLTIVGVVGLVIAIIIPSEQVEVRRLNCLNSERC